jgi:hypothetical protein
VLLIVLTLWLTGHIGGGMIIRPKCLAMTNSNLVPSDREIGQGEVRNLASFDHGCRIFAQGALPWLTSSLKDPWARGRLWAIA